MAITLSQLHGSYPCLRIGDITYFKARTPKMDKKTWHRHGKFWLTFVKQDWLQPLLGDYLEGIPITQEWSINIGMTCLRVLERDYIDAKWKNTEPAWLKHVPIEISHYLSSQWLLHGDTWAIVPHTMNLGFGFFISDCGLVENVVRALGLFRLHNIRQLAFLTSPIVIDGAPLEYPMGFEHTRYLHSLEVYAIATLVGKRLGLTPEELILLQVAALSHDVLTPAGGDVLKLIDPKAFDEDANYSEIFQWEGWKELQHRYGLDEEKLFQIILGKGLLGSILDLSDKLAYTARDSWEFLERNEKQGFVGKTFAEYEQILAILKADPYPCALWQFTERLGDELVFNNDHRLVDFIRLRALMFKILYANAAARFIEAGFVADVAKILYSDGVLTRRKLLAMQDHDLFSVLGSAIGDAGIFCPFHVMMHTDARVITFATAQEAHEFERRITQEQPQTMTRFEQAPPPPTKILNTFKVIHNEQVVSFSQALPKASNDIAQISHNPKPFWVYVYDTKICRNEKMRQRLLTARNERLAKQ